MVVVEVQTAPRAVGAVPQVDRAHRRGRVHVQHRRSRAVPEARRDFAVRQIRRRIRALSALSDDGIEQSLHDRQVGPLALSGSPRGGLREEYAPHVPRPSPVDSLHQRVGGYLRGLVHPDVADEHVGTLGGHHVDLAFGPRRVRGYDVEEELSADPSVVHLLDLLEPRGPALHELVPRAHRATGDRHGRVRGGVEVDGCVRVVASPRSRSIRVPARPFAIPDPGLLPLGSAAALHLAALGSDSGWLPTKLEKVRKGREKPIC